MPNPRTRARRLRLFALPFVFAGAMAFGSVHQIWYTATLSPTQVQGQSVQATLTLTGAQISHLSSPVVTPGATTAMASTQNPSVGTLFGIIDPIAYVILAAALLAFGALAGSVLLSGAGLLLNFYAWTQLIALRSQFENPLTTGSFSVLRGPGQARLFLSLTTLLGFGALGLIQVILVHRAERIANHEPSLSTHVLTALSSRVSTIVRDVSNDHEKV